MHFKMAMNLENIFVQVPTAIFWKDLNSVFLGCNNKLALDAGLHTPDEIIGRSDYNLVWSDYADYFREGDKAVLDGVCKHNAVETQNGIIIETRKY